MFKRLSQLKEDIFKLYDIFSNFTILTGDFCDSSTIVIRDKLIYDVKDGEFPGAVYVDPHQAAVIILPYLTHEGNLLFVAGLKGLGWNAVVGSFVYDAKHYYTNLRLVIHQK